jgi:hypothetical protein
MTSGLRPPISVLAAPPPPDRASQFQGFLVGASLLILTLAAVWAVNRQLESYFSDLDAASLRQAEDTLDALVNQQRVRLITGVRILVDDTRIRTTAMTTGFDEGTIRDVLDDLKKASDVSVLAVLDEHGKVRAITGAESLRQLDLSSSPVIRAAQDKPASYFWTLPDQVLIIGVAPIRTGPRVAALLLMGTTLGNQELSGIQRTLGVMGAVFNGDRPIATSSGDPGLVEVFRSAKATGDIDGRLVRGYPDYLSRVTRTNDSATAAKVVWLVPRHRMAKEAQLIRIAIWIPAIFATANFGLILLMQRKRNGGVS